MSTVFNAVHYNKTDVGLYLVYENAGVLRESPHHVIASNAGYVFFSDANTSFSYTPARGLQRMCFGKVDLLLASQAEGTAVIHLNQMQRQAELSCASCSDKVDSTSASSSQSALTTAQKVKNFFKRCLCS